MSNSFIKDLAREQATKGDYFGTGSIFIRPGRTEDKPARMREPWETWLTDKSPNPQHSREFFEGYTQAKKVIIFEGGLIKWEETSEIFDRVDAATRLVEAYVQWRIFEYGVGNSDRARALNIELLQFGQDIDPYHAEFRVPGEGLHCVDPVAFAYSSAEGDMALRARAEFIVGAVQSGPWYANGDLALAKLLSTMPLDHPDGHAAFIIEGMNLAYEKRAKIGNTESPQRRVIDVIGFFREDHPEAYAELLKRGLNNSFTNTSRRLGDIESRWGVR